MGARVRLGCKISCRGAAGWMGLRTSCFGVVGQGSPYKSSQGSCCTEGLALCKAVLWNGICIRTSHPGWPRSSSNIQMECSATFFATYSLCRVGKAKPGSQLVRGMWREIEQWVGSGCDNPSTSLPLSLFGDLFLWVWNSFLFLSGQRHCTPIKLYKSCYFSRNADI